LLTGLADGLALREQRYALAIRPNHTGPPLPDSDRDSADAAGHC